MELNRGGDDITCPYCGTKFDVTNDYEDCKCSIGQQDVKCPECGKKFLLRTFPVTFEALSIEEENNARISS